ncbi:MAG: cell division protein ZapA [Candidatus Omnitrophica bacterium]|nr:cell division protein ZapA [Candidatus Omnitrophota bacterium]
MKTVSLHLAGRKYTMQTSLSPESVSRMEKNINENLALLQMKHPSSDLIDILVFSLIEKWEQLVTLEKELEEQRLNKEKIRLKLRKLSSQIEEKLKELTASQ